MRILPPLVLLALLAPVAAGAQPVVVRPTLETQSGTLAIEIQPKDTALWVNSLDPGRSLLLVADSSSGLISFTLEGQEFQLVAEGVASGVDVQDGVNVAGVVRPLVVTANLTLNGLVLYVVDAQRIIRRLDPNQVLRATNFSHETVSLYLSPSTGRLFAFSGDNVGSSPAVVQLEMTLGADGGVSATEVRRIPLDSPAAGLVADDEQGVVFIAERNHGVSRISAEPDAGTGRDLIVPVASGGLGVPVGGLSLYRAGGTTGYLIVANTSADSFNIYNRQPPHGLVGAFLIGPDGGIDAVTRPNTVDVTARSLGSLFPQGLVVADDSSNVPQNQKLVSWPNVANAFSPPLIILGVSDGGIPDGGQDGGINAPGGPSGPTLPLDDPTGSCHCSAASVPGFVLVALVSLALGRRRRS